MPSRMFIKKYFKLKYLLFLAIIVSFVAAILIPAPAEKAIGNMFLGIVGILFGIIIGFYITDLYTRFARIRELIGTEVSALGTSYAFAAVLGDYSVNKKWFEKFRELMDKYVVKVLFLESHHYAKSGNEFDAMMDSLKEIKELKTNKETETYTNVLPVLSRLSDAREDLTLFLEDRLTPPEWLTILSLGGIFLFNLFYLKTPEIASIVFTGTLSAITLILMLVIRDLDSLTFGYDVIGYEPYERILDLIDKPRFYRKEDIETGVVKLPTGIKYRTNFAPGDFS